MSELYVDHEATLPPSLDPDMAVMTVVQASPLLVRETLGVKNLNAFNAVPNWVHAPGDPVLVRLSTMTVEATLASRPQSCVVTGVSGTLVTATGGGKTWTLRAGSAPAVGSTVAVAWGSEGGVVIATISGSIPSPTAAVVPALPVVSTVTTLPPFRPTESGTYRTGSRRGDAGSNLYQGHWIYPNNSNDNTGIWCYGDSWGAVRGKTVVSASMRVIRGPVGSGVDGPVTVHIRLHNVTSLPASTPGLLGYANDSLALAPSTFGDVDVTAGVQAIADGTASGFAVYFVGTADYAMFLGAGSSDSGVVSVTVR
jgi:hypothetical protein